MGDIVLGTLCFEPVGASPAGGDNGIVGVHLIIDLAVGDAYALAGAALHDNVKALEAEHHLNAVFEQILLDGVVKIPCLLGAEVADGAVDELQTGLNCSLPYLLDRLGVADALNLFVCAEFKIDLVGVVDSLLSDILTNKRRQIAADLVAERKLAVRESACAGESGGYMAIGLAADAVAYLGLGTLTILDRLAFLDDKYLLLAALTEHFKGGEDTGGACADDDCVVIQFYSLLILLDACRGAR